MGGRDLGGTVQKGVCNCLAVNSQGDCLADAYILERAETIYVTLPTTVPSGLVTPAVVPRLKK